MNSFPRRVRRWNLRFSTLSLGLLLAVLCFFLYLTKQPVSYTYDGMVFASRVENADTPLYKLFHPHHLIYAFLGRGVFLLGKSNGATWDGMVALQFFNILTGLSGILLAFHLLVRETDDRLLSGLTALGLCLSFSYWYFSTSPGVRIFAAVTPLLAWYALTFLKKAAPSYGLVIGLAHGLAVLGHQTNLLLLPAFLCGIWCLPGRKTRDKFLTSLYYLSALGLVVLAVYGFVGRFIYLKKTYAEWIYWVFAYFHVPGWGGYQPSTGFEEGKYAMVRAFLAKTTPLWGPQPGFNASFIKSIFQFSLLSLLAFFTVRMKFYWREHRQVFVIGFLWLLAYIPFFIWWEPWNIEFWVSSTIPCWILMGVIISDFSLRWKNPVIHFANRGIVLMIWSALVFLLFLYNFQGRLQKTPMAQSSRPLLKALDWKVRRDDLLVLTGINTVPFYIDRYQKRKYLSLHAFFKKYQPKAGGKKMVKSDGAAPDPWVDLSGLFETTWKHHRKVWVMAEAEDKTNDWYVKFERLMGIPDGKMAEFFHGYRLKPVPFRGKIYFSELYLPGPPAGPDQEPNPPPAAVKEGDP